MRIPNEANVCIHHLSHPDVSSWIERVNRYTSRPDRSRVADEGDDLAAFAHARLDHWLGGSREGYPAAVGLLRAVYDIVDRLKTWEQDRGLDGHALFAQRCSELDAAKPPASLFRRLTDRWFSRPACHRPPE